MNRKRVPIEVETTVLAKSARRCTLCFLLSHDLDEKHGQIAHVDQDPSNYAEDNLAFMCLEHHSLYDSQTSQHKNYTLAEVKAGRTKLYEAIARQEHCTAGDLNRESTRYHSQPNGSASKATKAPTMEEYGPNLIFLGARPLRVDFEESKHVPLTIHESTSGPYDALIASFRNEPVKDRRIEPLYGVTAQLIFADGNGVEIGNGIPWVHWLGEGSDCADLIPGGQARSLVLLVKIDDMIATFWKRHSRGSWMGPGLEEDVFKFDQCPKAVTIRLLSKNGDLLYEVALNITLTDGGFSATPSQH